MNKFLLTLAFVSLIPLQAYCEEIQIDAQVSQIDTGYKPLRMVGLAGISIPGWQIKFNAQNIGSTSITKHVYKDQHYYLSNYFYKGDVYEKGTPLYVCRSSMKKDKAYLFKIGQKNTVTVTATNFQLPLKDKGHGTATCTWTVTND